jgi:hypothetical protein
MLSILVSRDGRSQAVSPVQLREVDLKEVYDVNTFLTIPCRAQEQ